MAAPTMTRAPPPRLPQLSSDADADADADAVISPQPLPPPHRPLSGSAAPKNPWRINPRGGGAAPAPPATPGSVTPGSVTLMGEPSSSWPPLSSSQRHRRSDSPPLPPPLEIHPDTVEPSAADPFASSSSSSSELGSYEEMPPPNTERPAATMATPTAMDNPASSPAPPALAPALPRISPGNAAAAEPPRSPRPPVSPHRRGGRSQRFHHQRGGGGHRNHYGNRPPAPGWRPNWSVNSPPPPPPPPQYPSWGFYPGPAVGVVPPAELNPYFVSYPQAYGELVYADYSAEQFAAYYDHAAYEMPYVPPLDPEISTSIPPPVVALNVNGDQTDKVKNDLLSQIEYYFSEDNLVKDTYLRRQMDHDGWVDVHKIATFRRVAALTKNTNLIMDALESSNIVELQGNKMRKRHDWDRWILQQ